MGNIPEQTTRRRKLRSTGLTAEPVKLPEMVFLLGVRHADVKETCQACSIASRTKETNFASFDSFNFLGNMGALIDVELTQNAVSSESVGKAQFIIQLRVR